MNKKEADEIAWELIKLAESFNLTDKDATMMVSNQAQDTVINIISKFPKIKQAFDDYKATEQAGARDCSHKTARNL